MRLWPLLVSVCLFCLPLTITSATGNPKSSASKQLSPFELRIPISLSSIPSSFTKNMGQWPVTIGNQATDSLVNSSYPRTVNRQPFVGSATDLNVIPYGSFMHNYYQDVAFRGNYAYVASYGGIAVYDISNASAPQLVHELMTSTNMNCHSLLGGDDMGVEVVGSFLYVSGGCEGIRLFSLADPTTPLLVRTHYLWDPSPFTAQVHTIEAAGNYLYCGGYDGVYIVDVSNPANPVNLGKHSTENPGPIVVYNNLLYFVDNFAPSIEVLDLSDPLNPQSVGGANLPEAAKYSTWDIKSMHDNLLIVYQGGDSTTVANYSLVDPLVPAITDSLRIAPGSSVARLEVKDSIVYVAKGTALSPIRLSSERKLSKLNSIACSWSRNLASNGQLLCVIGQEFELFDLANLSAPGFLGRYDIHPPDAIEAWNGLLYVGGDNLLVRVFDATDVDNVVPIGELIHPTAAVSDIALKFPILAVATGNQLFSVDVSAPTTPTVTDSLPIGLSNVIYSGGLLYGAHGSHITIIGESGSSGMEVLGSCELTYDGYLVSVERLTVDGCRIYAACGDLGIFIVDATNPTVPQIISRFPAEATWSERFGDVEAYNGLAYLAGSDTVLDVSDPANPIPVVGGKSNLSSAWNLLRVGTRIVAADEYGNQLSILGNLGQDSLLELASTFGVLGGAGKPELAYTANAIYTADGIAVWQYLVSGLEEPQIDVSPTSLLFDSEQGGNAYVRSRSLNIVSLGLGTLNWQIAGVPDWLSVDPAIGANSQTVSVSVTNTNMQAGIYEAALVISSNDPERPQITVPVHLELWNPIIPVVLVHGWTSDESVWGDGVGGDDMISRLQGDGHQYVWRTTLNSCGTPEEDLFKIDIRQMYRGNAELLANFIEAQLEIMPDNDRKKVSEIDIIGHSMGGLIARRFISTTAGDSWLPSFPVRKLIMLGTPNLGSGLAGKAARYFRCNGPAAEELHPDQMTKFNAHFKNRSTTDYYVVYGSGGGGWLSAWPTINRDCYHGITGLLLAAPNDGAVAATSVVGRTAEGDMFPLAFATPLCHGEYPSDQSVYNSVIRPILAGYLLPRESEYNFLDTIVPPVVYQDQDSLTLGGSLTGSFTVEENQLLAVYCFTSDPTIQFRLVSPSSTLYDQNSTTLDSSVVFSSSEGLLALTIAGAQSGTWQWEVDASAADSAGIEFEIIALCGNQVVLKTNQSSTYIEPGDEFGITVKAMDGGSPLVGLNVAALPIWNTVDTSESIVLFDDGLHSDGSANDGIYGYVFSSLDSGLLVLGIEASGSSSIGPIHREFTANAYSYSGACCVGATGNIDESLSETPDLSDLSLLIAYLTQTPRPTLPCLAEANANGTGSIDLSDLSILISYLTQTPRPVLPSCP